MEIAATIPQIFYDLIARVLPGFLFLLMLHFELSGIKVKFIQLTSKNSMAIVLIALVCVVLSYFMGRMLFAVKFYSVEERVKKEYKSKLDKNSISISEMYHRIRIKNATEGFCILKLRAEARMLETSRTGMIYIFIISLSLLLLSKLGLIPSSSQSLLVWGIKLCIPIIMAVAFGKCEWRAWRYYYVNTPVIYKILLETKVESK